MMSNEFIEGLFMTSDELIRKLVKESVKNPVTINFTKVRYYEFQAGALWKLSERRPLTQAEEVRRQWYRDNPTHD